MKYHKILVIGNISAGKTNLINSINQRFKDFNVISIDECRRIHGDGTFSGEYLSWSKFMNNIENDGPLIIEFSGAGPHKCAIREILYRSGFNIIVIFLSTDLDTCRERCVNRTWNIPYPWDINPVESLNKIDTELQNDWECGFWKDFHNVKSTRTTEILNKIGVEIDD